MINYLSIKRYIQQIYKIKYKEAKIKNTSGKEAPIYFIKTKDIDQLFEMIVSEPFGNKTFLKDVFGFRTRFVGKGII